MLKIIQAPSEVLSKVAPNLPGNPPKADSKLKSFLKDMEEALLNADDPKGVGLAAPQVGRSLSLFITKPSDRSKTQVFINPKILKSNKEKAPGKSRKRKGEKKLEGCLSLKDIWGEVRRSDELTLEYFDDLGKFHSKKFKGFMATIIQHEVDHLNGILFPKRVLEQKGQLYHSSKDEKGEMIFEPIEV